MSRYVAVVSGGMDSVTLAYYLADRGHAVNLLSFDYGQRHVKELQCAQAAAAHLGVRHDVVDLAGLRPLIATSALTGDTPVPDGHYAEESMKQTVVPNRNAIMVAVATGVAVAREADGVAVGVHAGDHYVYPDCRPEFTDAMQTAMRLGNAGFINPDFELLAPFVMMTKADICALGHSLNVPWDDTWSCYKGGDVHCGTCGTCVERIEAFHLARVDDPTKYVSAASQQ